MNAPSAAAPRPGDVLAGKYVVERILGRGGMGLVLLARHRQLDDQVAIKLLLPDMLEHTVLVARFLTEAKAARQIRGEHAAKVIDVGTLESGAPFMVMEFLDGKDLAKVIEESGPLPLSLAVDYVLQVCEALAEAHLLGIVHRDIKPANLFLTRRPDRTPCIKVLDFGIAKLNTGGGPAPALTHSSAMMGTVFYAAPEQLQSAKHVDERADIWAIGVTLFELVTGQRPFRGEHMAEVIANVLMMPPIALRAVWPSAPAQLDAVLTTCLQKNRTERFVDVAALAAALLPLASSEVQARLSLERIAAILSSRTSDLAEPSKPAATPAAPHGAHHSIQTTGAGVVAVPHVHVPAASTSSTNSWQRGLVVGAVVSSGILAATSLDVFRNSSHSRVEPPRGTTSLVLTAAPDPRSYEVVTTEPSVSVAGNSDATVTDFSSAAARPITSVISPKPFVRRPAAAATSVDSVVPNGTVVPPVRGKPKPAGRPSAPPDDNPFGTNRTG